MKSRWRLFKNLMAERLIEEMHMIPAHSLDGALQKARALVGKEDPAVAAIPDGVSVIVKN